MFDFNPPHSEFNSAIDTQDENVMKGLSKSELQFFEQLKEYIDNEDIYNEILKVFYLYVEGVLGADE
jgi:paired amphipathic helix protein Sin3a